MTDCAALRQLAAACTADLIFDFAFGEPLKRDCFGSCSADSPVD